MEINTYELAMDRMREQENKIQKLTQELEEPSTGSPSQCGLCGFHPIQYRPIQ